MVSISASLIILAPPDKVWDIVSDVDNEPLYWHGTKSVRNLSRDGNTIERKVIIAFKDSKCKETVLLEPKEKVEIRITDGPMKGTKVIKLNPEGDNTRVDVVWDIRLAGFLGMFTGMVKKHIGQGTEDALGRIAEAAKQST